MGKKKKKLCYSVVSTKHLSRAQGSPGDQADDRLGNVWIRSLTAAAADESRVLIRYHFSGDSTLPDAAGSRHRTQSPHAGEGGHRTTVLMFV